MHALNQSKPRIVFFGTPAFAAYSLRQIVSAGYNVVVAVTAADKPAGRGKKVKSSDVKTAAIELNIPLLQPSNLKDSSFQEELKRFQADLGVVIAFRMLPKEVWSMPKMGTFNLHASLLPQYRGAAPINHAIINGEKQTGVTTFFLKHEIDTGDVVLQKSVSISNEDNAGTLHNILMHQGGALVLETLVGISKGNWIETPQMIHEALKAAPKISREFCELLDLDDKISVHNKIRGLSPYPGAWMKTEYGILKIFQSQISDSSFNTVGIVVSGNKLYLNCKNGALEIIQLQAEGKPRVKAQDFINGLANR